MIALIIAIMTPLAVLILAWLAASHYRDARRLDWLERTRSEIDTEGPGFIVYNSERGEESELGVGASGGSFKRLRSAIDSAMKSAPSEEPGEKHLLRDTFS
jgi:hypothetical protein